MSRNSFSITAMSFVIIAASICFADRIPVENDFQGVFDRNHDGFLTEQEIPPFKEIMKIKEEIGKLNHLAEQGQHKVNQIRHEAEELEKMLRQKLQRTNKPDPHLKMKQAKHNIREMLEKAAQLEREGMEQKAHELCQQAEKMAQKLHDHHMEMQEKEFAQMKEHIVHLRQISEQAEKKGDIEKAKQFWRQSEEIETALKREIENREVQHEIDNMHHEFKGLMHAAQQAQQHGKGDKADDLREEARHLEMEIEEIEQDRHIQSMEKHINHLRQLAHHEEAKGNEQKARAIAEEAERIQRQLEEIIEERERHEEDEDDDDDDIEELEEELQDIRHELKELWETVNHLKEKLSDR